MSVTYLTRRHEDGPDLCSQVAAVCETGHPSVNSYSRFRGLAVVNVVVIRSYFTTSNGSILLSLRIETSPIRSRSKNRVLPHSSQRGIDRTSGYRNAQRFPELNDISKESPGFSTSQWIVSWFLRSLCIFIAIRVTNFCTGEGCSKIIIPKC